MAGFGFVLVGGMVFWCVVVALDVLAGDRLSKHEWGAMDVPYHRKCSECGLEEYVGP